MIKEGDSFEAALRCAAICSAGIVAALVLAFLFIRWLCRWRNLWRFLLALVVVAVVAALLLPGFWAGPENTVRTAVSYSVARAALNVLALILAVWFIRWLCRERNFRRFAPVVVCLNVLVALFYADGNWRAKRAWEKLKREWPAKEEKFDLASHAFLAGTMQLNRHPGKRCVCEEQGFEKRFCKPIERTVWFEASTA